MKSQNGRISGLSQQRKKLLKKGEAKNGLFSQQNVPYVDGFSSCHDTVLNALKCRQNKTRREFRHSFREHFPSRSMQPPQLSVLPLAPGFCIVRPH